MYLFLQICVFLFIISQESWNIFLYFFNFLRRSCCLNSKNNSVIVIVWAEVEILKYQRKPYYLILKENTAVYAVIQPSQAKWLWPRLHTSWFGLAWPFVGDFCPFPHTPFVTQINFKRSSQNSVNILNVYFCSKIVLLSLHSSSQCNVPALYLKRSVFSCSWI